VTLVRELHWDLYEALAGKNPMERSTVQETVTAITTVPAPDIRELMPECPAGIAAFLRDALSRDPQRRPGSAKELKLRLQALRAFFPEKAMAAKA
jgi:hypothetical protein